MFKKVFKLQLAALAALCGGCDIPMHSNVNPSNISSNEAVLEKTIDVGISYDSTGNVSYTFSDDIDISKTIIKDKSNRTVDAKEMVCGDKIEVYTDGTAILNPAESVKLTCLSVPGSGEMEILFEDANGKYGLDPSAKNIKYVINEDGTFTNVQDLKEYSQLYGSYREEDIYMSSLGREYIVVLAVYTFTIRD